MFSQISNTNKRIVTIANFAGLNHTDLPRMGEWYDMKNVSGNSLSDNGVYALMPRRSRAPIVQLDGEVSDFLYKNGKYYYSGTDGIYYFTPSEGNVRIYESEESFRLIEMGNKIFAFSTSGTGVSIERKAEEYGEQIVEEHVVNEIGATYFYRPNFHYGSGGSSQILLVTGYQNNAKKNPNAQQAVYELNSRTHSSETVTLTGSAQDGYYDATGGMLNVALTYAWVKEDGSVYLLHAREIKYDPSNPGFSSNQVSRYFLGTDNKFYYYNADSQSAYEITAPQIAILLRKGVQNGDGDETDVYPTFKDGDYITLSIGAPVNSYHSFLSDDFNQEVDKSVVISDKLLRIKKVLSLSGNTTWGPEGWEYCVVVDYDAKLIERMRLTDIIKKSMPYTRLTVTADDSDQGRQQLYPCSVTIEKTFPVLTAPLEHNNRIWGAYNTNNEIRASAQGNFENWEEYRGLASDSFAASIGTDGAFTASCEIEDYLFFFKENSFTCVFGTRPANFRTNTVKEIVGIKAADAASLQVVGRAAYYLGTDGRVYRFNGSSAQNISQAFGDDRYTGGTGAHNADKYYLLATNKKNGAKELLVYHTTTGMWFKEDCEDILSITTMRGKACALMPHSEPGNNNDTVVKTEVLDLDKTDVPAEENNSVEWFCESGMLGIESEASSFVSNLSLTMRTESGAEVKVYARYDNEPGYALLKTFHSTETKTLRERIPVRRCQFLRLKLEGRGFAKIYKITYTVEQGSEK